MTFEEYIGTIIRRKRKALGWSQEDLAELVDISKVTLSNIEQGRRRTTARTIAALFVNLDLDLRILSDLVKEKYVYDEQYLIKREQLLKKYPIR